MAANGVCPATRPSTVTSAQGLARTLSHPWNGVAETIGEGAGSDGVGGASGDDGSATDGPTATTAGADGDALATGEGAPIGVGGGAVATAGDARTGAAEGSATRGDGVSAGAGVTSV